MYNCIGKKRTYCKYPGMSAASSHEVTVNDCEGGKRAQNLQSVTFQELFLTVFTDYVQFSKRWRFRLQKVPFRRPKGHLSDCKRRHFGL